MNIKKYKTLKLLIIFIIIAIAFIHAYKYAMLQFKKNQNDDIITNMLIIQKKIKLINGEMKVNSSEDGYIGQKMTDYDGYELAEKMKHIGIKEEEFEEYYILTMNDFENMGISGELKKVSDYEYVINYKQVDVIYLKGINKDNNVIYRLSDMLSDENSTTTGSEEQFEEENDYEENNSSEEENAEEENSENEE